MKVIHEKRIKVPHLLAPAHRNIIVYGDNWPVVSAVRGIAEILMPDCHFHSCHSLCTLRELQHKISGTRFIFCLRPREHVYLFWFLTRILSSAPLLVITDNLLPADRVVLKVSARAVTVSHDELASLYSGLCTGHYPRQAVKENPLVTGLTLLTGPGFTTRVESLPVVFSNGSDLISFMNELLQQYMQQKGVSRLQLKILEKMRSEPGLKALAIALDISLKTLSYNKANALSKLGVSGKDYLAMYGTHFCQECQRTPFSGHPLSGSDRVT
ncbi:hypothetical protein HPX80_004633 [Salmonella enterica]|nr:hypothetical protein [Salmonella enterica]